MRFGVAVLLCRVLSEQLVLTDAKTALDGIFEAYLDDTNDALVLEVPCHVSHLFYRLVWIDFG